MNALKVEEWDTMINVNIHGVLNGIAAGLPIMEAQGGGQFINTASVAAHRVGPTSAVYSATKLLFGRSLMDCAKSRKTSA